MSLKPTLQEITEYLNARPNTDEFFNLIEKDQQNYLNLSWQLLNAFYNIQDYSNPLIDVTAEEIIYLIHNNIDFSLLENYQGLSEFNIGKGEVQGKVNYDLLINMIGNIPKVLLIQYGVEQIQEELSSDLYTTFSKV